MYLQGHKVQISNCQSCLSRAPGGKLQKSVRSHYRIGALLSGLVRRAGVGSNQESKARRGAIYTSVLLHQEPRRLYCIPHVTEPDKGKLES